MHDEAEIALVEAHPQRNGGDERLDVVSEQAFLERQALLGLQLAVVRGGVDAMGDQPAADAFGVRDRQRVDDAASRQLRQALCEPGESRRLVA